MGRSAVTSQVGAPPHAPTTDGGWVPDPFDAIVLAGGSGRRLGGVDKAAVTIAGLPMLDRVLAACSAARRVVVVGAERPTSREVSWAMEDPPGGGPLAGVGAGLAALDVQLGGSVVVLACDLPYITPAAVRRLRDVLPGHDAAIFADADGRPQPLAGAYATPALQAALTAVGNLRGQRFWRALDHLRWVPVPDRGAARDCDTLDDLNTARMELT